MTISIDPHWWQSLFDEVYLTTDARSVQNPRRTAREVDIFIRLGNLETEARILDMCGGHGRHALELGRRGYSRCQVLDYSEKLLAVGRRQAAKEKLPVEFMQGDARRSGLEEAAWDQVLILGNSLGYIPDPEADKQILQECRRILKPGGGLLLDVTDGGTLRDNFRASAWHEIGEKVVVCRQRELRDSTIYVREMVLDKGKGLIRDQTYGMRLYSADELSHLARNAGFRQIEIHDDLNNFNPHEDLGFMSTRLILTAFKP
jgi:D-alanine-D-alanine ligase